MFEKMLVQTNVYYGFLLEFRSLWRFKRWVNHCVKNWNGIQYFHRVLFVLTSLKIHIRKLLVVFFLPWGVMCYQFCDMIFFSLIKRLLQNRLCAENFLANTPYNDNTASGLTSRTEHGGNGIPTESNGRIKWGVDTHTQHTAVRTWQALLNWMAFSWFCLFCVILYLK